MMNFLDIFDGGSLGFIGHRKFSKIAEWREFALVAFL